ncbi:MAG: tetratricopeptide repeat protein [Prolixibacteraceae bacterium]|nr:tetratricopeptide repeat protein [Prolixibacteraceae bacterium]
MKKVLLIIFFLVIYLVGHSQVQQQRQQRQLNIQLAVKYYNEKNYEKAAPLFKEVLSDATSIQYFRFYLNCLIQLQQFDEAEKEIKKELRQKRLPESELYIQWGHMLKDQDKEEEAIPKYAEAFKSIGKNKSAYLNTASLFIQYSEYEYAKDVYQIAKKELPEEQFGYELGNVYYYLRDFENMMKEYLDFIETDEKRLAQIQSRISSSLNLDIDNEMRGEFRDMVLKRVQANPNQLVFTRLYIWFLLQEKNFAGALRQTIALDRRTGNEDPQIANLAQMAANNRDYDNAKRAFQYLLDKGEGNPYYMQSFMQKLEISFRMFQEESIKSHESGLNLAEDFKKGLDYLGYTPVTFRMIKEYAHLLAFYLKLPDKAIEELQKAIRIRGLQTDRVGDLKNEMADIYVYSGDPWEATLIYSQVIDANKDNETGNQAKLKKARLSYFLGDFEWAQAQLDIIKASTSKLTSNDAFELSLLIGNNLNLDTTAAPLSMFARADFQFFRNQDTLALAVLDSLETEYPYHSLMDDILFRKARIQMKHANYNEASANLEKIITEFSYESLADDALFLLAEINQFNLKDLTKAQQLYKQMLVSHPGSIYVVESRKRFRILRGDEVEDEPVEDMEEYFFNGGILP